MLLSLLGRPTTRRKALTLFKLKRDNPGYDGTSQDEIGDAFARAVGVRRWRWDCRGRFDFGRVSRTLRAQLRGGLPTLISFGAVHKNGVWRCSHVAVVTGVTAESIELLDPLGRRPRAGVASNVSLRAEGRRVVVAGNSYSVDRGSEAAVLRWR